MVVAAVEGVVVVVAVARVVIAASKVPVETVVSAVIEGERRWSMTMGDK